MKDVETAQLLAHLDAVPSLPETISEIVALVNRQESSVHEVTESIKKDIGLTAKLLQLANSAYYSFSHRIGTIQLAISLLGMNEVRNVVLSASMVGIFKSFKGSPFLSFRELWVHSVNCAVAARTIASRVSDLSPEEAFVAGLLHDVGMVILIDKFPEQLKAIVQLATKEDMPFVEAEGRYWEHTHARIGGVLARKWKLPKGVAEAAEQHHFLSAETITSKLTPVVHLADSICIEHGSAYKLERSAADENVQSWNVFDENQETVRASLSELVKKDEQKARILLDIL